MAPADVMIEGGDMDTRLGQARLPASLAASAALHALGLLLAVRFVGSLAMPAELPRAEIIPVSLVSLPGGGGGHRGDGSPAPPPRASAAPAPSAAPPAPEAEVVKRAPPKRIARPTPRVEPAARPAPAPAVAAAPPGPFDGTAAGRGGGNAAARGTGNGDGSGGDGSGGARPAYGSNPRPPYPLAARRLHLEGRVLLDVVVRPDGRAASVVVRQSSGHAMLDASAADTVRERWRFVPARRNGVAIESTVTVPIRFRIDES